MKSAFLNHWLIQSPYDLMDMTARYLDHIDIIHPDISINVMELKKDCTPPLLYIIQEKSYIESLVTWSKNYMIYYRLLKTLVLDNGNTDQDIRLFNTYLLNIRYMVIYMWQAKHTL